MADKRLVVISGPSGVGKEPIIEWTRRLYIPKLCQVKVRKTKTERHKGIENDLGFDSIEGEYHQFDCRGTEQRIYLDELDQKLEKDKTVLLEVYYKSFDFLKNRYGSPIDFASTFVSPLNSEELTELTEQGRNLEDYLSNLMLDSLIKRAERDGKAFTKNLIKELEQRAEDSINEIRFAHNYSWVIPNHCYESDSRWRLPFLIGEPLRVVKSLKEIIEGKNSDYTCNGEDYKLREETATDKDIIDKKVRFKVWSSDYEPGCGCGCYENDLGLAQRTTNCYPFFGTRKEAEQELEKLKEELKQNKKDSYKGLGYFCWLVEEKIKEDD